MAMIKYLGSKRLLIPAITAVMQSLPGVHTVVDLFSGTSRVGHALKRLGFRVLANDYLRCAHALASCYVQADRDGVLRAAETLIDELNRLRGTDGYFTRTFCETARFVQPCNGRRIDAIRDAIEQRAPEPELKAVLLTSLLEAVDRVDSTTGVQMAYLKRWSPRSHNPLHLRVPDVLPRARSGKGLAYNGDAVWAAGHLSGDAAYIDPPYNQHSYLGNYHVWETLVRWDRPAHYGVACKRIDCRTRTSAFNHRSEALAALTRIIGSVEARYIVVSFSDEGFLGRDELESALAVRGRVHVLERNCRRYVGAQIGIHDPQGRKVGTVGHLRNTERLYVGIPETCPWRPDTVVSGLDGWTVAEPVEA